MYIRLLPSKKNLSPIFLRGGGECTQAKKRSPNTQWGVPCRQYPDVFLFCLFLKILVKKKNSNFGGCLFFLAFHPRWHALPMFSLPEASSLEKSKRLIQTFWCWPYSTLKNPGLNYQASSQPRSQGPSSYRPEERERERGWERPLDGKKRDPGNEVGQQQG